MEYLITRDSLCLDLALIRLGEYMSTVCPHWKVATEYFVVCTVLVYLHPIIIILCILPTWCHMVNYRINDRGPKIPGECLQTPSGHAYICVHGHYY